MNDLPGVISLWLGVFKHVLLPEKICHSDTLTCRWNVKQPTDKKQLLRNIDEGHQNEHAHQQGRSRSRSPPCPRCPEWPVSHGQRCRHHGLLSRSLERGSTGNTSLTARATRTHRQKGRSLLRQQTPWTIIYTRFVEVSEYNVSQCLQQECSKW